MLHRSKAVLALLFIALLFPSCRKHEPVAGMEGGGAISPSDIVAVLDGRVHTLFVLPEEKDSVLRKWGAHSENGETYSMEAVNIYRERVPITFSVRPALVSQLLAMDKDVETWYLELVHRLASEDTTRGEVIDTFSRNFIHYRTYKNAVCTLVQREYETNCSVPWLISIGDTTGNGYSAKEADFSERTHYYPLSHCLKGSGYCTEALVVRASVAKWDNKKCSGAPTSVTSQGFDFSCPDAVTPPKKWW